MADIGGSLRHLRMNDGACDPAGRLWAMATDLTPTRSSIYRVEPDLRVTAVRTRVSICNALDWSPDGRTFYFTDSTPGAWTRTET